MVVVSASQTEPHQVASASPTELHQGAHGGPCQSSSTELRRGAHGGSCQSYRAASEVHHGTLCQISLEVVILEQMVISYSSTTTLDGNIKVLLIFHFASSIIFNITVCKYCIIHIKSK